MLAIWSTLEGSLPRVVVMALLCCLLLVLVVWQRWLVLRPFSLWAWVGITAVSGLMAGLLLGPTVWLLMILKTGIHAHGPEFTPLEIAWVSRQTPVWTGVGLFAGAGIGLISFGLKASSVEE